MEFSRRQLIATTGGALTLSVLPCSAQAAQMVDVRMWPAKEYTRVTLEHDQPIKFRYFVVRSPKPIRLVVDIENLQLTSRLQKMISAVSPKDPFVKAIRIGQFSPKVVRLSLRSPAQVEGTQGFLPQPDKDLERPSSTRLEARFPCHDSRAMTRSPSPLAWRPDFPGAPREAH